MGTAPGVDPQGLWLTVTTATISRSLPVRRIGEDERPKVLVDHPDVGDRRVVWSAGSSAGAMRPRRRRGLLQRVGFIVASVAAVGTLASVVSTWSIIGPVGSDPVTALWIAPVPELDGGPTTSQPSTLIQVTSPDARSALPINSPLTRPSAPPTTLAPDSAAAGSSGSGSTDVLDQSGQRSTAEVDAKMTYAQDTGFDLTRAGSGQSSGGSEPGPASGGAEGSDGGSDDSDPEPTTGRDNGKVSDRRSERAKAMTGKAGTGAKSDRRPDSPDRSNLGSSHAGEGRGLDRGSDRPLTKSDRAAEPADEASDGGPGAESDDACRPLEDRQDADTCDLTDLPDGGRGPERTG